MDRLTLLLVLNVVGIAIGTIFGIIALWQRHIMIKLKRKELSGEHTS